MQIKKLITGMRVYDRTAKLNATVVKVLDRRVYLHYDVKAQVLPATASASLRADGCTVITARKKSAPKQPPILIEAVYPYGKAEQELVPLSYPEYTEKPVKPLYDPQQLTLF